MLQFRQLSAVLVGVGAPLASLARTTALTAMIAVSRSVDPADVSTRSPFASRGGLRAAARSTVTVSKRGASPYQPTANGCRYATHPRETRETCSAPGARHAEQQAAVTQTAPGRSRYRTLASVSATGTATPIERAPQQPVRARACSIASNHSANRSLHNISAINDLANTFAWLCLQGASLSSQPLWTD